MATCQLTPFRWSFHLSPVAAEKVTWSFDDPPPMVATSVGWACIISCIVLAVMKSFCHRWFFNLKPRHIYTLFITI